MVEPASTVGALFLSCILLLTTPTASAASAFAFSQTLGDHAVLQNPIIIWGMGDPGAMVNTTAVWKTGSFHNSTTVGADGIWRQPLPNIAESIDVPFQVTSKSAGVALTLSDLLAGKVILCSG